MEIKTKQIQQQLIKDFNKCIGKRLEYFRKLKGYSMGDFAYKLKIHIMKLDKYESGQKSITFPLLLLAMEILNISLDNFFGCEAKLNDKEENANFIRTLLSLKKENEENKTSD